MKYTKEERLNWLSKKKIGLYQGTIEKFKLDAKDRIENNQFLEANKILDNILYLEEQIKV